MWNRKGTALTVMACVRILMFVFQANTYMAQVLYVLVRSSNLGWVSRDSLVKLHGIKAFSIPRVKLTQSIGLRKILAASIVRVFVASAAHSDKTTSVLVHLCSVDDIIGVVGTTVSPAAQSKVLDCSHPDDRAIVVRSDSTTTNGPANVSRRSSLHRGSCYDYSFEDFLLGALAETGSPYRRTLLYPRARGRIVILT